MDDSCEIQHLPQPIPSFTNGAWMDVRGIGVHHENYELVAGELTHIVM